MQTETSAEFLEYLKAGRRAKGFDDSTITELVEETPDSSGTVQWSVIMGPRRPKREPPKV